MRARICLLALALLLTGCVVEAQAAPRDVRATVAIVADTAIVTVRWTPPPGNYDGFAVELRMAGRPVQAAVAPRAGAVATFRVLRPEATGEACVAATRGTKQGNDSCTPVLIQWPEEPIPDVGGVTVEIEVGAIDPPPADTTDPDPPPVVIGVPQPDPSGYAELPRVWLDTSMPETTRDVAVSSCAALQPALNAAAPGDQLVLGDIRCVGPFSFPGKAGTVVVRSAKDPPPPGVRVTPRTAEGFATLIAKASEPAAKVTGSNWRLVGLTFETQPTATINYGIVRVGTGAETSLDQLPANVTLDRVYIQGHDSVDVQRCLAMEARGGALINSWLAGCHFKGADAQAFVTWNAPGPFKLVNNHLEGSGENVMFGGADPKIQGLVACDIEFRRNHVMKPHSWRDTTLVSNGDTVKVNPYTEKNLFELKNSCRVLVEENVFENNWGDAQTGYALVFKSSNQSGNSPWGVTHDVTARDNLIKNSPGGVSFHRGDDYSGKGVVPMHNVIYTRNLHTGFTTYQGARRLWQITGAQNIHIVGNTAIGDGLSAAIMMDGTPSQGSEVRDNLVSRGGFGFFGSGKGEGTPAIDYYLPGGTVTGNILVGVNCLGFRYPDGNSCVTTVPTETTAGMDVEALMERLEGVVVAP